MAKPAQKTNLSLVDNEPAKVEAIVRPFDADFYQEAQTLNGYLKDLVTKDGTLYAKAKADPAINTLAFARDTARRIDAAGKDLLAKAEAALPPELKLKAIAADKKALLATLEKVDKALAAALMARLADAGELPDETDDGIKLTLSTRTSIEVTDRDQIPEEYLLPPQERQVDLTKIAEALKVEMEVNKTLVKNGQAPNPLSIPGVGTVDKITLMTKLPEIEA
jgi:hypothetical protein